MTTRDILDQYTGTSISLDEALSRIVPTQDSRDSKEVEASVREILEKDGIPVKYLGTYNGKCDEHPIINGIQCKIMFYCGWYCGYIIPDDRFNGFTSDDVDYSPYGEYTAGWGFDCHHCHDIALPSNKGLYEQSTFKTKTFVTNELKTLTSAINDVLNRMKEEKATTLSVLLESMEDDLLDDNIGSLVIKFLECEDGHFNLS